MPVLTNENMETTNVGAFSFSGTRVETLGATEYTLVTVAVDCSSSMYGCAKDVESAVGAVVESLRSSPRADNLMLRVTTFNVNVSEFHGFKPLTDCNPTDYVSAIQARGMTALCDAACDGVDALVGYGDKLDSADFDANGILFVLTDGLDNRSTHTVGGLAGRIDDATRSEELESIVTIMIGLGLTAGDERVVRDFATSAGFTKFVPVGDVTPTSLAKLAGFVSKSISAQSTALGSGSASQTLTF